MNIHLCHIRVGILLYFVLISNCVVNHMIQYLVKFMIIVRKLGEVKNPFRNSIFFKNFFSIFMIFLFLRNSFKEYDISHPRIQVQCHEPRLKDKITRIGVANS